VIDGNEAGRKRGAVTVLALFVGLLFGAVPTAQAGPDGRAQLGSPDLGKRGAPLRTSIRAQSDDRDTDSATLPPAPTIVTESLSARPAAAPFSTGWSPGPRPRFAAYRARAPPAI
jgi:hypothetical protein